MKFVISPAKTLDFSPVTPKVAVSMPAYLAQSAQLIEALRKISPPQLASLMHISDALAACNVARYHAWQVPFTTENAKPAVLAFMGDVYAGLNASSLDAAGLHFAQQSVRILSGLYGVLKPMDLIQAYRLEMGTALKLGAHQNLYQFWGAQPATALAAELEADRTPVLLNLASTEYFKAVSLPALRHAVITPVFHDEKSGQYKVISFYAKRARGMFVRYAIDHRITEPDALRGFDVAGYRYIAADSTPNRWLFRRSESAAKGA